MIPKERNKIEINELEFDVVVNKIKPLLHERAYFIQELIELVSEINEDKVLKVIRWLQDNEKIETDDLNRLSWKKQTRLKL